MNLRKQLLRSFLIISSFCAFVALCALLYMYIQMQAYNNIQEKTLPVLTSLESLKEHSNRTFTVTRELIAIMEKNRKGEDIQNILNMEKEEYQEVQNEIARELDSYRDSVTHHFIDERDHLDEIGGALQELMTRGNTLLSDLEQFPPEGPLNVHLRNLHALQERIDRSISLAISHEKMEIKERNEMISQLYVLGIFSIILSSVICIILAIMFSLKHWRKIDSALSELIRASKAIEQGNLDVHVNLLSIEEFNMVGQSFNCMAENLRNIQIKLIQTEKLSSLGEMAAGVAHELNNPLTAVKGYTEFLIDRQRLPTEDQEFLHKILVSSQRMRSIIDHLHTYARESRKDGWKPTNINDVVAASFDLLGSQLTSQDIVYSVDIPNDISALISANANLLESVFINLIANSRDAFAEQENNGKKCIEISCAVDTTLQQLNIIYKDNAGGMPPAVVNKIFDPFFTTKTQGKGTGLGMSISRGIILQHGGEIDVDSELGVGTTFSIRLPIAAGIQASPDKLEPKKTSPKLEKYMTATKPRLLVIDDEPDICSLLKLILCDDFDVEALSSPEEGLNRIQNEVFDLVLTDLKMPHISGIRIIESLKAKHPQVPILIMSGHARTDQDVQEALDVGANGLITKPFDEEAVLISTLRGYIDSEKVA